MEETPSGVEQRDHLLRNGIIAAIILPLAGAVVAIRLFARNRTGEGLAVLLTALVVAGVYVAVFAPFGSGSAYSAYSSTVKGEVEGEIRQRIESKGEATIDELSCVAQSDSSMTCLAVLSNSTGKAQAEYPVTIDQSSRHYIISSPQVHAVS